MLTAINVCYAVHGLPTAVKLYLISYPQKYMEKFHRHKWGKTASKAAIGVGLRGRLTP